jgi:hypothetical protein
MTMLAPFAWPPWALMWALAIAIYAGCKWLTWWTTAISHVPVWRQAAYLLAWPGLDAASFLEEEPIAISSRCRSVEWLGALGRLAFGFALFFGVARMIPPRHAYVVGWIGMIGLVLILHFGIFHLVSCWWRCVGVQARPLMNHPLTSTSLSEFWGQRWNTAFRDLTYRFLFRPFSGWFGPRWGIVAGFLFSGVIHDFVISVPARGGYGGPTIFFAVQGAAMVIERSAFGRQLGLGSRWSGRLFAAAVLLLPAGLLFHRPFVVGIIVPFMRFLGAI